MRRLGERPEKGPARGRTAVRAFSDVEWFKGFHDAFRHDLDAGAAETRFRGPTRRLMSCRAIDDA
jgi:hypothetical protein